MVRRLTVFGPAIIVVLSGLLGYLAIGRVVASRDWVQHTHDVLDASSTLLTAMLDAETGQRGFLLTHDTTFLGPYRSSRIRANRALDRLRTLTIDNPLQQRRIDTLSQRVARRLAVVDSTIDAERNGKTNLVTGIDRFGPGRSLMTDIRRLVAGIESEEDSLLVERRETEATWVDVAGFVVLAGAVVAGLLAFTVNRNFDRALRDRRLALADVTGANEKLRAQADSARSAMLSAEESERRAERLQMATEAFTGALSLTQVGELIVEQAMLALGAQSGALAEADRSADAIRFVALRNVPGLKPGDTMPLSRGLPASEAIRTNRPVFVESLPEIERRFPAIAPKHKSDGVQAAAAFPMALDGDAVGAILVRFNEPRMLTGADQAFMAAMSRIAAETFDRARLFEAERQAREQAESANRAKAAFLASMSHELRTPLQAALGFAQLVRSEVYGPINAEQAEVLERVERSQTHLARLIDDVLDFARLEAGRVRIEVTEVRLAQLIADLAPLVEPQAAKKKIELSLLPPPESLVVRADAHRLQQILVNVVGNAIKFTPEQGLIRVGALQDGDSAVISVRDTGMGIPADRLQSIFEPFIQVENGLTRNVTGAGLGLAISRDLARAMGGDLTAESELGKGSTFFVRVPLA